MAGLTALGLLLLPLPTQANQFDEYEIKAAFLYQFTLFVEWPPESFPDKETPLVIGILGADPFGRRLDRLVADESVKGRKVTVRRYRRVEDIGELCHILFISRSEAAREAEILQMLKSRPILIVGESPEFTRQGGMVQFHVRQNKVQLEINLEAAQTASLVLSSRLLKAASVKSASE